MLVKSMRISAAQPSVFYLLMAATCFRRAGCSRHPNASGALRDIGRGYLAKAGRVIPTHGYSSSHPDRREPRRKIRPRPAPLLGPALLRQTEAKSRFGGNEAKTSRRSNSVQEPKWSPMR
jgi:hypothetical protein